MLRLFLYGSFFLALVSLTLLFARPANVIDQGLWGQQAVWLVTANPEVFDLSKAYGHPGGPLLEAAIALHSLLGTSYESALALFEVVAGALSIALITTLSWLLRREPLWSVGVLGILLFDPLYLKSSPPSFMATLLGVLLALYTLWLYEKRPAGAPIYELLAWSGIAGALAATRADIGGVLVLTCALLLYARYGMRLAATLLALAFAAFCLFDPFMWFMPLEHIRDLFEKMLVHYTGTLVEGHDYVSVTASYAARALAAFTLAGIALLLPKRLTLPLPRLFLALIMGVTALVSLILLTAGYEALRYFMPLIFIWEILLPLFLLTLMRRLPLTLRLQMIAASGAVALLVVAPASLFLPYLF